IGMVHQVKELGAEFKRSPFPQFCILDECQVEILVIGPRETITPRVAEGATRRQPIRQRVKPATHGFHRRAIGANSTKWIPDEVWTGGVDDRFCPPVVEAKHRRKRYIAMEGSDTGDLPSTQQYVGNASQVARQRPAPSYR